MYSKLAFIRGLSRLDLARGKGAQDESAGTTVLELPPVEEQAPLYSAPQIFHHLLKK